SLVATMARAAVAAGADGLMVEVHPDPEKALSDGFQALTPATFRQLMTEGRKVAEAVGRGLGRRTDSFSPRPPFGAGGVGGAGKKWIALRAHTHSAAKPFTPDSSPPLRVRGEEEGGQSLPDRGLALAADGGLPDGGHQLLAGCCQLPEDLADLA